MFVYSYDTAGRMENQFGAEKKHWKVCNSRVNIAALLNDPRKSRRDYDFFTKTWGDCFKHHSSTSSWDFPEGVKVPSVSKLDFVEYFGSHCDKLLRYHVQHLALTQDDTAIKDIHPSLLMFTGFDTEKTKADNKEWKTEEQRKAEAKTIEVLQTVPELFLQSDFSIENCSSFMSVLNFKKCFPNGVEGTMPPSKLLQEKLSHYLDSVEVAIIRQISIRSDGFFVALASHDDLSECLEKMSLSIVHLREKISAAENHTSNKGLEIVRLLSNRRQKVLLVERLFTMITVHQAQPTIQLLLSTNEYAGALDLIKTTQEALKEELEGLNCFRHLGSQLSVLEDVISRMMKQELSHCIIIDLERPLEEGSRTVNPHHLKAIAVGLLRRNQLIFVDEFREEVKRVIKCIIKNEVMKAIDTADRNYPLPVKALHNVSHNGEAYSPAKPTTLAGKMRLLNFDEWIYMLDEIFTNLTVFLRRVVSFLAVIANVISTSFLEVSGYMLESFHCQDGTERQGFVPTCAEFPSNHCSVKKDFQKTPDTDNVYGDMDHYEEELMESVTGSTHSLVLHKPAVIPSIKDSLLSQKSRESPGDFEVLLRETRHCDMMCSLFEVLSWTAEFAYDRCVKVIIAKNKDSSLDKLTSAELLRLSQAIEKYLTDADNLLDLKSWSSDDSKYLIENFNSCYGTTTKGGNVLRGVLQSHALQFINRFHDQKKTNLILILNNETWRQAEVPIELLEILQNLSRYHGKTEVKGAPVLREASTSSTLHLDGIHFTVSGSVLLLLKMVIEYIRCADDLPASTPDLVIRVTELLTIFNSRACQLVLGAGALQVVGLKTISTKNLSLVSRCLQLVLHLLPAVEQNLKERLARFCPQVSSSSNQSCLKHFEHVAKTYQAHVAEIDHKLVSIMNSAIENNLSKWQVRAPTPSKEFRTICRHMLKFHNTVDELLPKEQVIPIFEKLHEQFKEKLKKKLQLFAIYNDGGPVYRLVTSDLAFYEENMKSLKVIPEACISLQSIWN